MQRGTSRTRFFKFAVVCYYRKMQETKRAGLCNDPENATRIHFGVFSHGQISGWAKLEDKLRAALLSVTCRDLKSAESLIVIILVACYPDTFISYACISSSITFSQVARNLQHVHNSSHASV